MAARPSWGPTSEISVNRVPALIRHSSVRKTPSPGYPVVVCVYGTMGLSRSTDAGS
jgi:hypothetical protein